MPNNNSHTFWISISFLVVGLIIGLLVTDAATQNNEIEDASAYEFSVDKLRVVAVSQDNDAVLGNPNAPVTMIEFSDFQCPYCEKFYSETFKQIKSQYIDTGKVKFIYRDFPIPSHAQASLAAESAECVRSLATENKDSAYFKMHDKIFENMSRWANNSSAKDVFVSMGNELGVDIAVCLDSGSFKQEVGDDYTAGRSYGVQGTPSFFINGKMVLGAESFENFQKVIESEL